MPENRSVDLYWHFVRLYIIPEHLCLSTVYSSFTDGLYIVSFVVVLIFFPGPYPLFRLYILLGSRNICHVCPLAHACPTQEVRLFFYFLLFLVLTLSFSYIPLGSRNMCWFFFAPRRPVPCVLCMLRLSRTSSKTSTRSLSSSSGEARSARSA